MSRTLHGFRIALPFTGSTLTAPGHDARQLCNSSSAVGCRLHRRKDWRLVVTGHSLGAGVAVLICTHLRLQFPGSRPCLAGSQDPRDSSTAVLMLEAYRCRRLGVGLQNPALLWGRRQECLCASAVNRPYIQRVGRDVRAPNRSRAKAGSGTRKARAWQPACNTSSCTPGTASPAWATTK